MVEEVKEWIQTALSPPPLLLGIQGVQGSGKTTMAEALCTHLGLRCVALSLDDFYLPSQDLEALQRAHPEEPRLHGRGNPGTHDLEALLGAVDALRRGEEVVRTPRFDKALRRGQGDRAPRERLILGGKWDVVLVEGWCLGFEPLGGDVVDAHVRAYTALTRRLDGLILLPGTAEDACVWRAQAERAQRGRDGMTEEEVAHFMQRYLPTYERYLARLHQNPPVRATLRLTKTQNA